MSEPKSRILYEKAKGLMPGGVNSLIMLPAFSSRLYKVPLPLRRICNAVNPATTEMGFPLKVLAW